MSVTSATFSRGQAGNQVVELEHEAHVVPAVEGQDALVGRRELLVPIEHPPPGRYVETSEDVQERGFAAARGPEEHHQLAQLQLEVDSTQSGDLDLTHPVDLGDVLDAQQRRHEDRECRVRARM
jgi:hypothetical protein